jgi:hypothetical protein
LKAADIKGQCIYLGPRINSIGLGRNMIFRDGVHQSFHVAIEACPAIGALIVPITQNAEVRKQLAFDYAGNMRGTSGKFVAYFREVQNWLAKQATAQKQTSTGVNIKHHA